MLYPIELWPQNKFYQLLTSNQPSNATKIPLRALHNRASKYKLLPTAGSVDQCKPFLDDESACLELDDIVSRRYPRMIESDPVGAGILHAVYQLPDLSSLHVIEYDGYARYRREFIGDPGL